METDSHLIGSDDDTFTDISLNRVKNLLIVAHIFDFFQLNGDSTFSITRTQPYTFPRPSFSALQVASIYVSLLVCPLWSRLKYLTGWITMIFGTDIHLCLTLNSNC